MARRAACSKLPLAVCTAVGRKRHFCVPYQWTSLISVCEPYMCVFVNVYGLCANTGRDNPLDQSQSSVEFTG